MKDIKNTFIEKLYECNQHKSRLLVAKKHLSQKVPFTKDNYDNFYAYCLEKFDFVKESKILESSFNKLDKEA